MRRVLPAVCLLALAVPPARAAEEPSAQPAAAPDRSALDRKAADILREVHNRGADLYNSNDPAGCYRLLEGCLRTLSPLLDHRPELQADIARGLEAAEKEPNAGRKAFALHELVESARGKLKAAKPPEVVAKPEKPPVPVTPEKPPVDSKEGRLGTARAGKVVADFFTIAARDPAVNLSRDGKYPADDPVWLTARLFLKDWLVATTGGQAKPSPDPAAVAVALKAAGVTSEQFAAASRAMRTALESNGADKADVEVVLKAIEGRKADVVTEAPPPPPKPAAGDAGTVKGTVTLDGKPLAEAGLQFVRTGDAKFLVFDGKTNGDGAYSVPGVLPGKYLVILDGKGVPPAYQTTTTTPLTAEVKAGDNPLSLELKGK